MHRIPEPNVRELLLPILSFLPVAFVSGRPPPDFLLLLSPVLRQRVHLRSSNSVASPHGSSSASSNWLSLLTWSSPKASQLVETCAELNLEPHPVSGELELFDDEDQENAGKPQYRRLDAETFQARCDLRKYSLSITWVWCENDDGSLGLPVPNEAAEPQNGWKVAEVLPISDDDDKTSSSTSQWFESIPEAEEAFTKRGQTPSSSVPPSRVDQLSLDPRSNANSNDTPGVASDASGEDDYWASYDRTPNQTPRKSPVPPPPSNPTYQKPGNVYNPSINRRPSAILDAEYYERYGSVQPSMDAHDPDEEEGTSGFESTLHHNEQEQYRQLPILGNEDGIVGGDNHAQNGILRHVGDNEEEEPRIIQPAPTVPLRVYSPTPSRPSSSSSGRRSPIEALEASATSSSAAEVGVKQHISTELKSLFRLARSAGIERSEFERVVKTELDVLGMMDV